MPDLYIIAGCNGAGKTTASFTILPEMLDCKEFVNADEIARGLSPFKPESVSFQAGRIMLERINQLINERKMARSVKNFKESDRIRDLLIEKGIVFEELPDDKPWLWREARLKDPDNNQLIIYFAGKKRTDPPWKI